MFVYYCVSGITRQQHQTLNFFLAMVMGETGPDTTTTLPPPPYPITNTSKKNEPVAWGFCHKFRHKPRFFCVYLVLVSPVLSLGNSGV